MAGFLRGGGMSGMLVLSAFALSYAGWVSLALGQDKYHRQVWSRGAHPATRRLLKLLGVLYLAISMVVSVAAWGGSIGFVAWFGVLTAGAIPFVFLLPYAPRAAAGCALLASALAAVGLGWHALA